MLARELFGDAAIAIVVSLIAAGSQLGLDYALGSSVTPFLASTAAVIFSAAWVGPVAGSTATLLMTAFCAVHMQAVADRSFAETLVACLLFAAEGALVTFGSARLLRTSRQLEQSRNHHRQMVDTAAEGILIYSANGVITYANARMRELLGAGPAGLEQRKFEEFIFPEDLAAERIRLQRREVAVREQFDRRLRRADGAELWVLSCSNPLLDDRGNFAGVLCMMTDITERKAAETALRASEERFRSLFENVLEGVYQSTPDGRILAANPMLLKMLDLKSEAEMNDVNISKDLYVDPKVRSRLLAILERDGSFQNVEYDLRRRDGRIITVLENARVVRGPDGEVLYYEGTLSDITERKRVDQQLREAQKAEMLGGLAAGIAQDFNGIMTVVTGYCELLASDSSLLPDARNHAIEALKAAEKAGALTRQLMALRSASRAEDQATDLSGVIRRIEPSLRASLGGSVRLDVSLEEGTAVLADAAQIEQIVANLTTNSREAMPGGGLIEIATEIVRVDANFCAVHPGAEPGTYGKLSVRDSGLGIPPHLLGKLTDPMFTMGKSRWTGLGLSTVSSIAARHGGFITADSTPGQGTVFSVYLPLAAPAERTLSASFDRAETGETILLVEEEPLIRQLSSEMLARLGYHVIPAATAGEAERIAGAARRLDLLVANFAAGHESGTDLAMRLSPRFPALKVLLISGLSDQWNFTGNDLRVARLRKPFSPESLGRAVRRLLDRR